MANRLKMALVTTVYMLLDQGWSQRRIAGEPGTPLIQFDVSSVRSKWVGKTESNVRTALRQAESMTAPDSGDHCPRGQSAVLVNLNQGKFTAPTGIKRTPT